MLLQSRFPVCAVIMAGLLSLLFPSKPSWAEDEKEEFQTRLFFVNPADGTIIKQVAPSLNEYQSQGSPCRSLDGKLIAFDAWKAGESFSKSKVIVINADGTEPRIYDDAAMPSFSPGGNRLVFSRPNARGVWVANVNSQLEDDIVLLDDKGWGADWSPDGKIAYGKQTKNVGNLVVVDLVEEQVTQLFDDVQGPYSSIYWNMGWSPDGKRIGFKASDRDGKIVIGIVDARGEKFGHVIRDQGELLEIVTWTQDASQLLFLKKNPERGELQIHAAAPDTQDPPTLFGGLVPDRGHRGIVISRDGKELLMSCTKKIPAKPKP